MKIGYFADGPWSHRALERICADARYEVAFIVPRFDTRDPVLAHWAERIGADFLLLEEVNAVANIERLRAYRTDIFVSMSYNQIFREPLISVAPLGVVNCHAGALPFYRGRNILNWALINDAKEFGVTAHYVNEGIDTGDIIIQRKFPIADRDTYGTLLSRAIDGCAEVLIESLDRIANRNVVPIRQASIHPVGMYCGRRRAGDEWIDWNWPSRRIFNFVRAIAEPGPGARTSIGTEVIEVLSAEEIPHAVDYVGTPGEVVGVSARGPVVKTGDSSVLLTRLRTTYPKPLRIGNRLGLNPLTALVDMQQRIDVLERELRELTQAKRPDDEAAKGPSAEREQS